MISFFITPWELALNKIWQIENKRCKECGGKENLIIDVYNLGGFLFTSVLPKSWLCNYHYRKDKKITHDDFTTWLDIIKKEKIPENIL